MSIKKRVLTGITTSGTPHLGNLAGAVLPAIQASKDNSTSSFLFLADYHSLIKNLDPKLTHSSSLEIAACWLACGLNPKKVTFYRQSDIQHIMELTWILSCLTAKGLLNRAHAYKDAVSKNQESKNKDLDKGITMGLFNYPILMAADILMFNADIVPVGQDQQQHLEMTREIARRFNHHYQDLFTIPNAQINKVSGVIPGLDGNKMSKSYNNVIPVFESKDKLRKSIMKIQTNSLKPGDPKKTEGCTIFKIFQSFADEQEQDNLKIDYSKGIAWGEAKERLFELLLDRLDPYRQEYKRIIKDKGEIENILQEGASKAHEISSPLMLKIREAVGIKSF